MKHRAMILVMVSCALTVSVDAPAEIGAGPDALPESPASGGSTRATLPASWDNLAGLPPVGDQVVAGSCYAWAAAYYYLTHLQWRDYGWDVNDPAHQCSPAFVYNLTNGGVDDGAWEGHNARSDAFSVFETMGCATIADMPYDYRTYQTFPTEAAFRSGMRFRTLSTHLIPTRTDSGIQALKEHLVGGDLAVLGIFGYQNLNNIGPHGNIYCLSQTTGSRLFWHEVTVIGFDDSLVTADGKGAFHLVNSWGSAWGSGGFFWMSYQAVKAPKTSYGYAMYATDRPGYHADLTARIDVGHSDRYNLRYAAGLGDTQAPDTLLTFFDFHPMSLQTGVPYPDGALVVDLTDMRGLLQASARNRIFVRIEDRAPGNGRAGAVRALTIEDMSYNLCASLATIPASILDAPAGFEATVPLDYSLFWPQNVTAVPDSLTGQVELSWNSPTPSVGLTGYRIYLDGRLLDTASTLSYRHFLSLRGQHTYGVSAVTAAGESPGAMAAVRWTGPVAFGIPFADDFENGFGGWYQVGSSGVPSMMMEDSAYEGRYAAGIKTYPSDYTALARPFNVTDGADIETWFCMDAFPGSEGGGGSIMLVGSNMLFGTFIDGEGHPAYLYSISPGQQVSVRLDSVVTVNRHEWYKQKLWYSDGILQMMLLDSTWSVIFNRAVDVPDLSVNQVALIAQGLDGGWNFFDKFSIRPWTDPGTRHFMPVRSTGRPYALVLTEAAIDCTLLREGDEIAVLDGGVCVGGVVADGEWPLEMNVWEAHGGNPGFVQGDTIRVRFWLSQTNEEYETDLSFAVGDGTFGHGLFSRLGVAGTQIVVVRDDESPTPRTYVLRDPYPNPFNPTTTLSYDIAVAGEVRLAVYDLIGREVAVLVNERKAPGTYAVRFDGSRLASGIYVCRLQAGDYVGVKRVVLVR